MRAKREDSGPNQVVQGPGGTTLPIKWRYQKSGKRTFEWACAFGVWHRFMRLRAFSCGRVISGLPHLPGVPNLHVNRPLSNFCLRNQLGMEFGLQLAGAIGVYWLVPVLLVRRKTLYLPRLITTDFTRRQSVATFCTYKRKTNCSLSGGYFDSKDFSIKRGVAGQVMQL